MQQAAQNDLFPNVSAGQNWNLRLVRSVGSDDGGVDITYGNEGDPPFTGLDSLAAMVNDTLDTAGEPTVSFNLQSGNDPVHIPAGSQVEDFAYHYVPGRGVVPVSIGLFNITDNGIESA